MASGERNEVTMFTERTSTVTGISQVSHEVAKSVAATVAAGALVRLPWHKVRTELPSRSDHACRESGSSDRLMKKSTVGGFVRGLRLTPRTSRRFFYYHRNENSVVPRAERGLIRRLPRNQLKRKSRDEKAR